MQYHGAAALSEPNPVEQVEPRYLTERAMLDTYGPTMTLDQIAPLFRYAEDTLRQYMKRKTHAEHPLVKALKAARIEVNGFVFNTSKIAAFLDGRHVQA